MKFIASIDTLLNSLEILKDITHTYFTIEIKDNILWIKDKLLCNISTVYNINNEVLKIEFDLIYILKVLKNLTNYDKVTIENFDNRIEIFSKGNIGIIYIIYK